MAGDFSQQLPSGVNYCWRGQNSGFRDFSAGQGHCWAQSFSLSAWPGAVTWLPVKVWNSHQDKPLQKPVHWPKLAGSQIEQLRNGADWGSVMALWKKIKLNPSRFYFIQCSGLFCLFCCREVFYPPWPLIRFKEPILVVTLLHTFFPPASCRAF